jgi:tetratricopeptide (TPR) repeat protein
MAGTRSFEEKTAESSSLKSVSGNDLPQPVAVPLKGLGLTQWGLILLIPIGGLVAGIAMEALGEKQLSAMTGLVVAGILLIVWKAAQHDLTIKRMIAYYEEAAKKDPSNPTPLLQAGLWCHKWKESPKDISKGREFYQKILERVPGERNATILLAVSFLNSGEPRNALDILQSWLPGKRDYMGSIIAAQASKSLGEHDRAVLYFRHALELFPETPKRMEIESYIREHSH